MTLRPLGFGFGGQQESESKEGILIGRKLLRCLSIITGTNDLALVGPVGVLRPEFPQKTR